MRNVLLKIRSVLSGDNFLNDVVFFLLRKLGFNDFTKLAACVGKVINLSVVFAQILDH